MSTPQSVNPLMAALKLPGRMFQLPSRGLFYTNGELDASIKEGEIHVQPMSALDEITLKNPDQLFSGAAIDTVFKTCISGINKPGMLLAKDVDAIMMFLRSVTYGSSYEFMAKHTCKDAKNHSYIADVDTMIASTKFIDPTSVDELYTLTLPNAQVVKLNPNRYASMIEIVKLNQSKEEITVDDQHRNLVMMVLAIVSQVDDITDRKFIEEWVRGLPGRYVNLIGAQADKVNDWGADTTWKSVCKDCNKEFEIDIPINPVSFFIE